MAGTTVNRTNDTAPDSVTREVVVQFNKMVDDLATLRSTGATKTFSYKVENLAAGADIAARALFQAPAALTITAVSMLHEAAGTGVDGSNTAVLTLRNITEAVDIATVTLTSNPAANAASTLAITGANADIASADVLGIVVTQGATADLASMVLQFTYAPQAGDAAGDLLAAKIGDRNGGAVITV